MMKISGHLVDIHNRDIYPAAIVIRKGIIERVERKSSAPDVFILPGLIDSHIHIESSMITPGAFGLMAVRHGTTGVVSDPHEIANVMGWKGIAFMIKDAKKSPVRFWFGAPSCVPATDFETNGARLNSEDISRILKRTDIKYLSEMMNFPGVLSGDQEVMSKLEAAKRLNKPIDGHAPGLRGEELVKYVNAGISTDHECSTIEEAKEKISLGMKVLIREGSAARNLNELKGLYITSPDMIMLCSDDLHPEMLRKSHINKLIAGLITEGFNLFDVIRSATLNPVLHYGLEAGLLQAGQSADFILVDSLRKMHVKETWIKGIKVFENGMPAINYKPGKPVNNFKCKPVRENDFIVPRKAGKLRVIEAFDGQLLTKEIRKTIDNAGFVGADTGKDILKIVVKDRYRNGPPATAFIKGFGLKQGAFAGSISHDSHNIVCVGTNDKDITAAINEIIRMKGGLAVSHGDDMKSLQLDIAGIMTTRSCEDVADDYKMLNDTVKSLGCKMSSPFMTLSFMALLVIPDLKMSDRGLFDVNRFEPVELFA
jgi:adenine deaminase